MEIERKMVNLYCSTLDFMQTWMLTDDQIKLLSALMENELLQDGTNWSIIEKRNIKTI